MKKIAINGFGRIGRIFFRQVFGRPDFEIVAINDLGEPENLAYLLKHDSVYKAYDKKVQTQDGHLVVDGTGITVLKEKDPAKLPWAAMEIDIVIECTGIMETAEKAKAHIDAGAKHVVITALPKDDTTPTATPGLFTDILKGQVTANASCTTNAMNPVAAVMSKEIGILKGMMSTIHANTATQKTVDGPGGKSDMRYGRASAWNIIPTVTGAAKGTTRVLPELKGKFDGISIRVPIISGSLIDFTFLASRPTTVEEVNDIFKKAAASPEWQGILEATDEPLVSSDILGNPHGSIVDLGLTKVVDGDLVKVFSWYDNEWGYCAMLLKHVQEVAKLL